ncbi:uncharacterized protein LOC110271564 [Arachis ipaensis]|uniref:uncharacterized protein LOC110271564 n=1 Tax=Arachis ipaensis TaxID=130454 RepID=UPI000A2B0207|nr:uncharacterized protein LOC110271564 [Arachis ipaensis]
MHGQKWRRPKGKVETKVCKTANVAIARSINEDRCRSKRRKWRLHEGKADNRGNRGQNSDTNDREQNNDDEQRRRQAHCLLHLVRGTIWCTVFLVAAATQQSTFSRSLASQSVSLSASLFAVPSLAANFLQAPASSSPVTHSDSKKWGKLTLKVIRLLEVLLLQVQPLSLLRMMVFLVEHRKVQLPQRCLPQILHQKHKPKLLELLASLQKRGMGDWNGSTLLNGELMHMRCCAHILNLIVGDGMKEIDSSITKIRIACKFVRSSPARMQAFKRCVREANITSKASVVLDVPTRWNSTYLMLKATEKFESDFSRLSYQDSFYLLALESEGGPPDANDWTRERVFVKFLKIFYDATLTFSGSLNVTCNNFFNKLCDIQKTLNKWRKSNDVGLQKMATQMKVKLDKYWEGDGINYFLFVAVFLDLRYKYEYVEFCLNRMYGLNQAKDMLKKLKDIVHKLFEYYSMMYPLPDGSSSGSFNSSIASHDHGVGGENAIEEEDGFEDEFRMRVKKSKVRSKEMNWKDTWKIIWRITFPVLTFCVGGN